MKTILKIFIGMAILGAVGLVSIILLMFLFGKDAPPPQDDDLQLARVELADDQNAFHFFTNAAHRLVYPTNDPHKVAKLISGESWDAEWAQEILAQSADAFSWWSQGLARDRLQYPEMDPTNLDRPFVSGLLKLGRLAPLQGRMHMHQGREEEAAFENALSIVRYGTLLGDSGGVLIDYLVGLSVFEIGMKELRTLTAETTLPPERLLAFLDALDREGHPVQGLADAFRSEYQFSSAMINQLAEGRISADSLYLDDIPPVAYRVLRNSYFFQVNRTRQMFADFYRTCIDNVPRLYNEMEWTDEWEEEFHQNKIVLMLKPNGVGKILQALLMPAMNRILERKCHTENSLAFTRVLIMLKCFQARNGSLPAALSDLVPEYLDRVPLDQYDGKPIRYDLEKRILYSVGKDGIDSGGSPGEKDMYRAADPTCTIEF